MTALDTTMLGRFRIPRRLILEEPEAALAILDGCIVVRAEQSFATDGIEYVALHPHFQSVEPGCEPPLYLAHYSGGRRSWAPVDG